MKYSTFRSNRCAPSRCSRIARFVSGVIQFSRPISSSGPQGLFETFSPSLSTSGSKVRLSSAVAIGSSSRLDGLGLLDVGPVQLGAPVAEEVQLVVARDDVVLVPRLLDVDVGDEQRLAGLAGLREPPSVGVDDLASAAEL